MIPYHEEILQCIKISFMNTDHLRALMAAVDEGTFDAAADSLLISGSAFSQRIKALEKDTGQVLLTRTVPVQTTDAGAQMLRLARQVTTLEEQTRKEMGRGTGGRTVLSVAVNADSLNTWFLEVLQQAATWDDTVLQLVVDDQEHTHELLRTGQALAAVSESPSPVAGCTVTPLGTMKYYAVGASSLLERLGSDFSEVPVIDFGSRDNLQRQRLAQHARDLGIDRLDPPRHLVSSEKAYLHSIAVGLGWGMFPAGQLPPGLLEGEHPDLQLIDELGSSSVTLHWQRWTAGTPAMDRLSKAVQFAARAMV